MKQILWQPSNDQLQHSQMTKFMNTVNKTFSLHLTTYNDLHKWACKQPNEFWGLAAKELGLRFTSPYTEVKTDSDFINTEWFTNSRLNYAEHCLHFNDDKTAIIHTDESGEINRTSYKELTQKVSRCIQFLKEKNIKKNDVVAAMTTNSEETIILFLACASLGIIWTSCSPDFGYEAIISRFSQAKPKVLLITDSYQFKGTSYDLSDKLKQIMSELPSVEQIIRIDRVGKNFKHTLITEFTQIQAQYEAKSIEYEALPFNHPLYILYSSGTTGKPKSLVHSAGGSLLEHLKEFKLHCDATRDDVIFYYTTCSWMMWNWLVSGLSVGSTLVIFDGSPFHPNKLSTWQLIDDFGITIYGTSAKYINASAKFKLNPKSELNLATLRTILSTGSVLYDEDFDYIYEQVKPSVQLSSISGGTDIVGCFALGNPLMPIIKGKLQSLSLGYDVKAYNEMGEAIYDEKGELVCEAAFPSMPLYFLNDPDKETYKNSYFSVYQNKWHHSDYVEISQDGSLQMCGRSDATLNRAGVRIGTAEIYQIVEKLDNIEDSLVIHLDDSDKMLLFIKTSPDFILDSSSNSLIKNVLRDKLSARHSPNHIFKVSEIPYTKNGKKIELAIKHLFTNNLDKINKSSLSNPDVLNEYITIKAQFFQTA
jgi:acetoacetyl-CoA synthetase